MSEISEKTEISGKSKPSCWQIAATFNNVSLQSYGGGVNAIARHVLVDSRKWLSDEEFLQALSVCQILPGPNSSNLAIFVGTRLRGLPGAISALLGLLVIPLIIVVFMGGLYFWRHTVPQVESVLDGLGSAAVGLTLGLAIKLGVQHRNDFVFVLFGILTFVGVAIFRFSMIPVILVLGPCAVLFFLRRVIKKARSV